MNEMESTGIPVLCIVDSASGVNDARHHIGCHSTQHA